MEKIEETREIPRDARKIILETLLEEFTKFREDIREKIIHVKKELRKIEDEEEDEIIDALSKRMAGKTSTQKEVVTGVKAKEITPGENIGGEYFDADEFCHECESYGHLKSCRKDNGD